MLDITKKRFFLLKKFQKERERYFQLSKKTMEKDEEGMKKQSFRPKCEKQYEPMGKNTQIYQKPRQRINLNIFECVVGNPKNYIR